MIASRSFRDRIPEPLYDDESAAGKVMAESAASAHGLGSLVKKVAMIAATAGASAGVPTGTGAPIGTGASSGVGIAGNLAAVGMETPAAASASGAGAFGGQSYAQRFGAGLAKTGTLRGGLGGMIADPNAAELSGLGMNTFDLMNRRRRGRGALAGGY